jgi:chaperonin GroEL
MSKMSIKKRNYSHKKIRRRRNIYIYIGKDEFDISSSRINLFTKSSSISLWYKIKSTQMVNNGYSPKDLQFGANGRQKLISGVMKMSRAVKSTLGPSGNTVLIESPEHTHGITVTKDGVTVAKSVDLMDPVENLAVRMMKEAADKTATAAGDGTTTAIVLTEALVLGGLEKIKDNHNRTEVLRHLVDMSGKVVEKLKDKSKKVTTKMLVDVATISANNDKSIGQIIAEVYKDVGKTGIVTVEKSQTHETYAETTMGLKFDRGYSSPLFINDQKKDECVFEDVMVLVADMEIANILQIENILKPIITEGKKLLIISPCNVNVINTLAANVMKGNLKVCAVPPPNFGYKQHELMHDIAVSVGATYFSEKTGDDLSHINFGDLGHAAKVIVSKDKTVILKSDARAKKEKIEERVVQLWDAHAQATRKNDKDFLLERIASLTGGIGVIFVGGNTDLEQKELYDRVDDAVCAVRSALEEGILPGAGKALAEIDMTDIVPLAVSPEINVAADILRDALQSPLTQILENAGLCATNIYNGQEEAGFGYNLKTGEKGDLIKMGVIDPLKVTRSALQNAISVAVTILSTNAIITMARSYESDIK